MCGSRLRPRENGCRRWGEPVWNVTGSLPEAVQAAIVSHLKENCRFTFEGPHRLSGERVPFYGEALLCQLVLEPGSWVVSGRRRKQHLVATAVFYLLYKGTIGDELVIPLTGGEGDIKLAKRWLGLTLPDDEQRLNYARFYYAFALTEKPPQFRNVPRNISELRFAGKLTEQRIWGVYGAVWRYFVDPVSLDIRAHFEPRGTLWFLRHRAHLPMQFGSELCDVDLKIWNYDGHVSHRKAGLIYRDPALAEEPRERAGKVPLPSYIKWGEKVLALYGNFKASINQAVYLVSSAIFLIASVVSTLFPMHAAAQSAIKPALQLIADTTGIGDWSTWLKIACFYCLAYFVLTTLFILDLETLRNSLLTWSKGFKGSWFDGLLYGAILKGQRTVNGYRRGLIKRVGWAVTRLFTWTAYLVLVFTSLQISFRPNLASDGKALLDVMQVFSEQALLYIPVVFYYVGRKSLDPARFTFIAREIMIAFQLIMGLLVIRRVHRFWASTAASRLRN
jgi:hypothetical protein